MEDHDRSERHDEKSEKPPVKPIDNKVLAAMLRESASIVERGEFEPILYTALQDFRVYYKVHYPVKKNKHRSRSRSLTREKEKKSNKSFVAKEVSTGSESSSVPSKPPVPTTIESVPADTDHGPIDLESTEDTMPSTMDVLSTIMKHVDAEGPGVPAGQEVFEPEPKIEPHIPDVAGIVTAIPLTHSIASHPKPSEQYYSPGGTIQKASANVLFGKLKFPKKIGVTLPNPTFVTASKKNAERAKEDLEAFNGHLAQQAESSRRRKTGMEDGVTVKWCEVHFAMNCACKERTTSTKNVTHEPLSQSQPGERAQMSAGQRDEEKQELLTQTAQPSPTSTSTATNSTGATTVPTTRAPSAGDSPDASLSPAAAPETAAAAKEAHSNPFDNIQEGGGQTMTQQPVAPLKPDFQRPANANSTLIANGWIEQQRRSKMRFVWKEVLASLVQGRKPGEETTLWIQREIFNPVSQKKELEALHQIPVKLLESCAFLDYSTDNRFTLKLFNATEEFVFRCRTDSSAAKWVQVLKKHHEIARGGPTSTFEEEKKGPENSSSSTRMTVNELRAICHGAGINTAGMERPQLEAAAEEVRRRGTYFAPPPGAPRPIPIPPTTVPQQNPGPTSNAPHVPPEMSQASGAAKLSVSELRAICHGAGINTVGMERSQLERAAEEVRKRGTYFPPPNTHAPPPPSGSAVPPPPPVPPAGGTGHAPPPPPSSHVPPAPQANSAPERLSVSELRAICHGAGINTVGMERQQLERAAEEVRKRGTYFDRPSTNPPANTAHHPPSASVPEDVQREAERQKMEEEQRRRMAEQEHQRRVAEQQAAEQHRRYAEQQAAWQKQQQEEEHRRRLAEQQAAEQRRRHEEAVRQQQQWQQQQWQKQQQQQQQQQWNQQYQQQQPPKQWPPNQAPPSQHPHWQQQQHPQQANHQQQQRPQPNQQQQQQPHHSAASEKYAKMANQTDDEGQAMITRIKHDILIHWALQPPQLQMLRPIDVLVTTIHKVFPPALGVPAHDYFSKFKPVSVADVSQNGSPDEEGLKKAVRKIRFFLHPDKLPKDLNPEQAFMVKMLWDVTSDAWDEFEKRKADLDWIK